MTEPNSSSSTVLFICNTNGGKSQIAAALLRSSLDAGLTVQSAGLIPAHHINELAADVVASVGADMRAEVPTALTEEALRAADRVIIVGQAQVPELEGVTMERWVPAEAPAALSTEREHMEFLRDEIAARVRTLKTALETEGH